jgi:precorrin-3B synthase
MQTGDGLLVRLMPLGTLPLAAFAGLCAAARTHGNGVIEITSRGNIQVRGLSAVSATQFAADIAALRIAAADGIAVLSNALAGLDAAELLDSGLLAADLRRALAQRSMAAGVGAKVSVAIDGGGIFGLDWLAADVRLCAAPMHDGVVLRAGIGGDAASAVQLGHVAVARGVEVATRLLDVLAERGREARAREIVATEGCDVFRSRIADLLLPFAGSAEVTEAAPMPARSRDLIGMHRLRGGSFAAGIGLAFGHADARSLERLTEAAGSAGATGLRVAAGRTLIAIGLPNETLPTFVAAAEALGFIVRAGDPRRHVVACAGAPTCASAVIAARAIGPAVAAAAAPFIDGSFTIHVSGCAKGCAHAAPAALTIVGTNDGCALVADGSARDIAFAAVSIAELPATIAHCARGLGREARHG